MKIKSFISTPSFWIPLFLLVVFLMFFVSSARKENFRTIGGTWSQDCYNASEKDGVLTATCPRRGVNTPKQSTLDTKTCHNSWQARNYRGVLSCT